MTSRHVTMTSRHMPVLLVSLTIRLVTCQVDMFELHDRERGDVAMHVTRDSAQIEAVPDSVSLVMNPFGAPGASIRSLDDTNSTKKNENTGGNAAIVRDKDTSKGYVIGNLDQTGISMKKDGVTATSTVSNENTRTLETEAKAEVKSGEAPLPQSTSNLHFDQNDFSVKRSHFPPDFFAKLSTSMFGRASDDRKSYKLYEKIKRHFRPRSPCFVDHKKAFGRNKTSNVLGDIEDIIEKASVRVKRTRKRADTRQEGELYSIHDGNQNRRFSETPRSCVWEHKPGRSFLPYPKPEKAKDVNATKKSFLDSKALPPIPSYGAKRFSRLPDSGSAVVSQFPYRNDDRPIKRSGFKEMNVHNEIGQMRIHANPEETAVTSESGNIEILMLNDNGPSSKKSSQVTSGIKNIENDEITGSTKTLSTNENDKDANVIYKKPQLHIAEDLSIKKSAVNHPIFVDQ